MAPSSRRTTPTVANAAAAPPPSQRHSQIHGWQQAVGRLKTQHTRLLKRVQQLEHLVATYITSDLLACRKAWPRQSHLTPCKCNDTNIPTLPIVTTLLPVCLSNMASEQQEQLYAVWGPVWASEEASRIEAWNTVLLKHTIRESGKTYDLPGLAELGLQDVITQAQSDHACELRVQIPHLVQTGFPMSIRGLGWKHLLDVSVRRHRGHYNALVQQSLGELASQHTLTAADIKEHVAQLEAAAETSDPPASSTAQSNTASLTWQSQAVVWLQQIEKDLPRTFSGHPVMEGAGRQALRRVLAAFAMHDPSVGYCQGMNFIAAVLLMFMSEEDAFWCLVIVVEDVLTGYFSPDMTAAKVDQRVFQQLVSQQLPAVAVHLEAVGADLACVAPGWFLCAFVNSLPLETCLRVWDVMFFKKTSAILFQVGLALVDVYSDALLVARDLLEAFQVVQGMASLTHDASYLLSVAMVKFSSLDDQMLVTLRAQALAQVEKQRAEDERADANRQLQKMTLLESARHLANQAGLMQPAAPAQPPIPQQNESAPISVVKKLLARLEKRTEDKPRPPSEGPYDRGGSTTPGENLAPSGDSDSDHDSCRASSRRSGTAGARGQSRRAGNHTVPDSNDSPLLKLGGLGAAAAMGVGVAGANVPVVDGVVGDEEEEGEDAEGTYVPPSVPLFPEAKELISLSPSESTAVPDIDDLLRLSSIKRGAAAANRSSTPPANNPIDHSSPSELSLGPSLSGPIALSLDMASSAGDGTEPAPSERSAGPAGLRLSSDVRFPSVGEDSPGTPAGLARDSRLQALDAMLWHETPPWKNIQQFSAAQRGEDTAATAPTVRTSADVPTSTPTAGSTGQGSGDPLRDTASTSTGAQDAASSVGASTSGAVARGSTAKLQPVQPTAPSPAMQLALAIALRKSSDMPSQPTPSSILIHSSGPSSPQRTSANTQTGAAGATATSLRSPSRSGPAAPAPAGTAAAPDAASVWRQAGWGLEVMGSAQSGRSLGVSSVPTEDLDSLHVGSGQHYSQSHSHLASNGGIVAGAAGGLTGGTGVAELKDDWVDLHAVGEDMLHPHGVSVRPGAVGDATRGQHFLFPGGSVGAGPVGLPPQPHPLHASFPAPHHGTHHSGGNHSEELRKTISNGWVDGGLLPALPSHSMLTPSNHSSSGALVLPSLASAPMPAMPRVSGNVSATGIVVEALDLNPTFSGHLTTGGLPPPLVMLSPLAREGLVHTGTLSSSGGGVGSSLLEVGRLQAGLPVSPQATAEAVMEVCQREGIQPLMTKCHTLNAQYKRVEAGRAATDGAHSDDEEDPLHSRPLASTSNRPLDTKSVASTQAPTSNYHRLLNTLLEHVTQALTHASEAAQGTSTTPTTSAGGAAPSVSEGGAEGQGTGGDIKAGKQAAAAALFSLQVAHQHLSEALEDINQAEQVEQELLRGYKTLANASCQKLHDMAGALAERDAVVEALTQKMTRVTQVYAAKEEQLVDKMSDQEDALRDMQQRLAIMATSQGSGQQQQGVNAEGSRIMGAFQKLRERSSRPSSPPVRRNGSNPPIVHPLLVPHQPAPEQFPQQGSGSGTSGGAGTPGPDDGAGSREEGRVTKWLAGINRFMKKEETAEAG